VKAFDGKRVVLRVAVVAACLWACSGGTPISNVVAVTPQAGGGATVYGSYTTVQGCDPETTTHYVSVDFDGSGKASNHQTLNTPVQSRSTVSVYFGDGTKLIVNGGGGMVQHTDASGATQIWQLQLPLTEIGDAALADDGTVLVGGTDNNGYASVLKLKEDMTIVWQSTLN